MDLKIATRHASQRDCEFVLAVARAIHLETWSRRIEERGLLPSGCDLDDYAPETTRAAVRLARQFVGSLLQQPRQRSLAEVLVDWKFQWHSEQPFCVARCGFYAAMEAMGHGVGLFCFGVGAGKLPYLEC